MYTHHYEQYMELSLFDHASEVIAGVRDAYAATDAAVVAPPMTRMTPRGLTFL